MKRAALQDQIVLHLVVLAIIVAIVVAGASGLAGIGLTGTALLLTLPVLWAASRGGVLPGSLAAILASAAFNFFLLPPRMTFHIDGATYVVTFLVFVVVALVTGATAAGLREKEREAAYQAAQSELESAFLADIGLAGDRADLDRRALAFLTRHFGAACLFKASDLHAGITGLAPLDAAAAIWALEHEAITGHASTIMPAADYRFFAFGREAADVLAFPVCGAGDVEDSAFLARLARTWGQARDHIDILDERKRAEEAKAREHTRRALLSALGHDFRTPLTVLKEGLGQIPDVAAKDLLAEVERLRRMGEDLLASARLDAGVALASEPVDLVDTLTALEYQFPSGRRDVAMSVDLPADLPLVEADPVMLLHLLGNVIDNGLRYASAHLSVSARKEGDVVHVTIADDGPGIPPSLIPNIFEPFVSEQHDGRTARGGTGLGLAIAHDLAKAMGADLALAEAEPDRGAAFVLRLSALMPGRDRA